MAIVKLRTIFEMLECTHPIRIYNVLTGDTVWRCEPDADEFLPERFWDYSADSINMVDGVWEVGVLEEDD